MRFAIKGTVRKHNINLIIKTGRELTVLASFNLLKPLSVLVTLEGFSFNHLFYLYKTAPVRPGANSFQNWTHSTTSSLLLKEIKGE